MPSAERICCAAPNTRPISACALSAAAGAVGERLQARDDERRVGLVAAVEQREADDRRARPATCGIGRAACPRPAAITSLVRATEAPSGNCTDDEEGALILLGQKARRRARASTRCRPRSRDQPRRRQNGDAQQPAHDRRIAVAHAVDAAEHAAP